MKSSAQNQEFIEKICEANKVISSPFITETDEIYFASYDGSIYRYKDASLGPVFEIGGQPSGLVVDSNNYAYIADLGHQAIISKKIDDKTDEMNHLVKDFEGEPLIGPNSLCIRSNGSELNRRNFLHRCRSLWGNVS